MVRRPVLLATVLAAGSLLASACNDSTGPEGAARVQIRLTDAPSDYIASAEIWVSAVYLQRVDEDAEGDPRVFLFDDAENPKHYDLMLLRDGVTADLTDATDVEAGAYGQLRLVVDSAFVTLIDGLEFSAGGNTARLKVPSGSSSGVKVQLADTVDAEEGETVVLLVDFDVDDNFRLQGDPDTPAGLHGILFTPVLREKSRTEEEG
jgi:hypothetical protein